MEAEAFSFGGATQITVQSVSWFHFSKESGKHATYKDGS